MIHLAIGIIAASRSKTAGGGGGPSTGTGELALQLIAWQWADALDDYVVAVKAFTDIELAVYRDQEPALVKLD